MQTKKMTLKTQRCNETHSNTKRLHLFDFDGRFIFVHTFFFFSFSLPFPRELLVCGRLSLY